MHLKMSYNSPSLKVFRKKFTKIKKIYYIWLCRRPEPTPQIWAPSKQTKRWRILDEDDWSSIDKVLAIYVICSVPTIFSWFQKDCWGRGLDANSEMYKSICFLRNKDFCLHYKDRTTALEFLWYVLFLHAALPGISQAWPLSFWKKCPFFFFLISADSAL